MKTFRARLQRTVREIQTSHRELAKLLAMKPDSRPGKPAPEGSLHRVEASRGIPLPPDFRAFLGLHDGWKQISMGMNLLGTKDLLPGDAQDQVEEIVEIERDNGRDLGNPLVFELSENDASLVFFDPATRKKDGTMEIVEYLYEENARHKDFLSYLQALVKRAKDWIAEEKRAQADSVTAKTAAFRARKEGELRKKLDARLAGEPEAAPGFRSFDPALVPELKARIASDHAPANPLDLILKERGKAVVYSRLGLTLYLGFPPTSGEMRQALKAYRRCCPWDGAVFAQVAEEFDFGTGWKRLKDPADERGWQRFLKDAGTSGWYGFKWWEKLDEKTPEPMTQSITIRGIPEIDDKPAASLCQVWLRADADSHRLKDLALALVDILPVRSGYAGITILGWDAENDRTLETLFSWMRRYIGLNVQDPNELFPQMLEEIKGANWLTILGRTFVGALRKACGPKAPSFPSGGIRLEERKNGVVIQAGDAPVLGDIHRGGFPELYAEVERVLLPLKVRETEEIPGTLYIQGMSRPWYRRLVDWETFLGPSARELSGALDTAGQKGGPSEIRRILTLLRNRDPVRGQARTAYNAGTYAQQRGLLKEARDLYEYSLALDNPPPQAVANLLIAYDRLGEQEKAFGLAKEHQETAKKAPSIYHNAACVYAKVGNSTKALELIRLARKHKYDKFDSIRTDAELKSLFGNKEFQALFHP